MNCPSCGRSNKEGGKFCIYCRAKLTVPISQPPERITARAPAQVAPQVVQSQPPQPKKLNHPVYIRASAFRVACPKCMNPTDPALRVCPRCRTPLTAPRVPRQAGPAKSARRRPPLGKTLLKFAVTSGSSSALGYGMNAITAGISRTATPATANTLAQVMPWVLTVVSFIVSTVIGSFFKPKRKQAAVQAPMVRRMR